MATSVPADIEAMLQDQVDRGRFPSSTDALREAVRLLEIRENRDEFEAKLDQARDRAALEPSLRWSDATRNAIWTTVLDSLNDPKFTYDPDVIPEG